MAYENNLDSFTLPANADYSTTGQYRGVTVNSSGNAVLAATAGQLVIGVLQNKPTSTNAATVAFSGITKVIAGTGGIAAGDLVKVDSAGAFVKSTSSATGFAHVDSTVSSTTDAVIGDYIVGICVKAAAATDIGSVLLAPIGLAPTTVQ